MRKTLWIGCAALALTVAGCGGDEAGPVRSGIEAGVDYIRRMQQADGSFVYRVHPDTAVRFPPHYNIVRHVGALYTLGQYAAWSGDTTVAGQVARGVGYMRACCMWPLDNADSLLPVWSPPDLFNDTDPLEAKLGAAGVGLVALVTLERLRPGSVEREELRGVARFIRFMLRPDGSYYSKYTPSLGGLRDDWTSLYYPGEAALGLAMLAEIDPDPRWREAALRILGHLASIRADQADVPPDHWALIATAALLESEPAVSDTVRAVLLGHARQIAGVMLSPTLSGRFRDGRLSSTGGTTGTATRLEGLLAMAPLFPSDDPIRVWIDEAGADGVRFLLAAQHRSGPYRGGIPRTHPDVPAARRADVQARRGEIRIDYVQHAVSAFVAYAQLLQKRRVE